MIRWRYYTSNPSPWDWYVQVDEVRIGTPVCTPPALGALMVGKVYDAPTNTPQLGATVDNNQGKTTTTQATPDPAVDDSFYTLFSGEGARTFTASKTGFGSDTQPVTVPHYGTIRRDLHLAAGHLTVTPLSLSAVLSPGASTTVPLSLHNDGTAAVVWSLAEIDKGVTKPTGPFQRPDLVVKPFKQGLPSAKDLNARGPRGTSLRGRRCISSWPSGLPMAWGVGL